MIHKYWVKGPNYYTFSFRNSTIENSLCFDKDCLRICFANLELGLSWDAISYFLSSICSFDQQRARYLVDKLSNNEFFSISSAERVRSLVSFRKLYLKQIRERSASLQITSKTYEINWLGILIHDMK